MYAAGHEVGLVLFGTKQSKNYLNDTQGKDKYQNVTTFRTIDKIDLDFLRAVDTIKAEDKEQPKGDLFDGIVVGMDLLGRHTGTKK